MKKDGLAQLRAQLISGKASSPIVPVDHEYFASLRCRVQQLKSAARPKN